MPPGNNSYQFLGVEVNLFNIPDLLYFIHNVIERKEKTVITHHNLHSIYLLNKNPQLRTFRKATINHVDGMSLILMGKALGHPFKKDHRITWVDLIYPLIEFIAGKNWKVFYVGSDEKTALKSTCFFKKKYPCLDIMYHHGFFNTGINSEENKVVVEKIRAFKPNILIIGMGMPRQEKWIYENSAILNADVIMTSGAVMEYVAGTVKTPPRWMGRNGLEWLYRLTEHPERFWFRYMVEPWFVFWLFLKEFSKKYVLRQKNLMAVAEPKKILFDDKKLSENHNANNAVINLQKSSQLFFPEISHQNQT